MRPEAPAVASVFDVEPRFIGGTETYARELSVQLGRHGWRSVLCFASSPPEDVRRFLALPNVSFGVSDGDRYEPIVDGLRSSEASQRSAQSMNPVVGRGRYAPSAIPAVTRFRAISVC